ncbi:hypothetical protein AVEN_55750-1 [Araneus ventricosus]|uniref:Uncharacterized protein n=1 Tax=Araneus ventricosus TaxID=182803 RepID=A0A4Y2JVW4_ARAVE|nr:hypothetical protein AVEN_55750-1 [Araneus ventricosus]
MSLTPGWLVEAFLVFLEAKHKCGTVSLKILPEKQLTSHIMEPSKSSKSQFLELPTAYSLRSNDGGWKNKVPIIDRFVPDGSKYGDKRKRGVELLDHMTRASKEENQRKTLQRKSV